MAEGGGILQSAQTDCPCGYPINVLEDLDNKYKCNFCNHVLKTPYQNINCGHRFCKDCLDYNINNKLTCKDCQEENNIVSEQSFLDRALIIEMNKLPAKCTIESCMWKGTFLDYIKHYKTHFPDVIFKVCKFGCKDKYTDENENEHMLSNTNKHLDHLLTLIVDFNGKNDIYEGVLTVFNREVEKIEETTNNKIKLLERQLEIEKAKNIELNLRMDLLETTSYDGTLLWKITDVKRRQQEAQSNKTVSIYSQLFYTSRTGYKMCGRIYLNGDGLGKGTHISLFFVLMKGTYDALLKWPFIQKVTLMIIDQNSKEHIMDAFRPDPTSSSFKRPVSVLNIASGCPLMLPLTSFNNENNGYVKDDTMFVKIVVSTDDLN